MLAAGIGVGGCATAPPFLTASEMPELPEAKTLAVPAQDSEYAIQAGDFLSIRFYYHPDHNQKMVLVRNDGKIALPLVGEVQAEGVKPSDLSGQLEGKYSSNLRDPKISVSIVEVYQNLVWVGGEVRKPGFVNYRPGLTATQALAQVGGAKDSGAIETCLVLQRTGREQYRPSKLNLQKVLRDGDYAADLVLAPQDVIFIPKTGIAKADVWVD